MKTFSKKMAILLFSVCFCLFALAHTGTAQEKDASMLVLKLDRQRLATGAEQMTSAVKGEIVYRMVSATTRTTFELASFSLVGSSIKTRQGDSGPLSVTVKPGSAKTSYDPRNKVIQSQFVAEVHYPLIDKIKGFMPPREGEREKDDFRSYTETFVVRLSCQLSEVPVAGTQAKKLREGAVVSLQLEPREKVVGAVEGLKGKFQVIDAVLWPKFYIKKVINIQPVFIRYTPAPGNCFGGSTTATTGGSFPTLRDKSIEMWNRCCLGLNFLAPVYISSDDYRILSSTEEAGLMAAYDDPNAVEVYFTEVGDPLGIHGGGVCYSGGTANTKVITYDTNLPVNLYNLAHELGHALGLSHPPGNSTPGSLMEPSGFCADNPGLMSKQNCDNAANPLLTTPTPIPLCTRSINMP